MIVGSHPRTFDSTDRADRVPVYVVWELTLKCNLGCSHCGSRAGSSRVSELTTEECFRVIDQLAALGTREITIIGGEAFLRRDWLLIVERISSRGILCTLQTGGFGLTEGLLQKAKDHGLSGIGVSIDGIESTHDRIRGRSGSFKAAINALTVSAKIGLETSANTQINGCTKHQLNEIYDVIKALGVRAWQLQLTVAMGNAADNEEILLQPYELDTVMPNIAALSERGRSDGIRIVPGNNIGYFGPYEHLLRGPDFSSDHYGGCLAGVDGMGIEADGTVKGCPSLATERYSEGNVRQAELSDIWTDGSKFQLNQINNRQYAGYCAECYYKESCRSGCVWTSDSLFGQPGNNPYCYYRVLQLKNRNIREEVVKIREATKASFGTGLFEIRQGTWNE